MIYIVQIDIQDLLVMDLCKINISKSEVQNVQDALNCELFYNDFDMEL